MASRNQVVAGIRIAKASMYPVETHSICSRLAEKVTIRWERATLTIELSRMAMNEPRMARARTSHL